MNQSNEEIEVLKKYCDKWSLENPVLLSSTTNSNVYKVGYQEFYAVLKVFKENGMKNESNGSIALRCFDGKGAVKLINFDEGAHLLEYIDGEPLKNLVIKNQDKLATEIIAELISKLHSFPGLVPDGLFNMEKNFLSLFKKAQSEPVDSIYVQGAKLAEHLINTEQEVKVLHGDIHHENILNSSTRGWLAIDPKCLFGESTYDLANTFYNPIDFFSAAELNDMIDQRTKIFSKHLKIDKKRILEYAFAYGCLSASWCLEDGQDETRQLCIARSIQLYLASGM